MTPTQPQPPRWHYQGAMRRGMHTYVFRVADPCGLVELARQLGLMAGDPHLNFRWSDAAAISQHYHESENERADAEV